MVVAVFVLGFALERPYDGVDQDGDGSDLVDVDGDGFPSTLAFGPDCADSDPAVHPGASDRPGDGVDADCGGSDGADRGWLARLAGLARKASGGTMQLFQRTLEHTHAWLTDIQNELGTDDPQRAWHALKAVLTTLRDRLPIEEVADLSAQLPVLVRGVFFEGWNPHRQQRIRSREDFVQAVAEKLEGGPAVDAEAACRAVMTSLRREISPDELEQVRGVLPGDLKPMLGSPLT